MASEAGRQTTSADAVQVEWDETGHRRLVTTAPVASGEEILALDGVVRATPTRYSIQIGPDEHLDDMGPIDATNHRCDPSAFIDFSDPERIVLRALRALSVWDEVSIHYCATEYDMTSPFDCHCGADACLGRIRGYRYVSDDVACDLEPWLSPVLRDLRPPGPSPD
ncbi:MAG: SET domain-containing protein [Gemmatimonadota bacterium]